MEKKCGNCKFWDSDNASHSKDKTKSYADCVAPVPISVATGSWESNPYKFDVEVNEGKDCPAFQERLKNE